MDFLRSILLRKAIVRRIGLSILACFIPSFSLASNLRQCSGTEAYETAAWQSAKPAHLPIELMIANRTGWVGLGHVEMDKEQVRHDLFTYIPWLAPQSLEYFSSAHASEELSNKRPVFYMHLSSTTADITDIADYKVQLARLSIQEEHRVLRVTSGLFNWNLKRRTPPKMSVPIAVRILRKDFAEITTTAPLAPGEYLLIVNQTAGEGFEFGIGCK